ncbi:hypothetical protein Vadar_027155 [Vaccinium darrowii]|uniref:Uncharacterized protein n=1 Tax=Vaccinium darrowii TaxID=229202 RepID=A0ACB7Z719_9ERIC|nr:hypothetical protein Vadar_027155 [Vaccinium darrowii]
MPPNVGANTSATNPPAKKAKKLSRADAKQAALTDLIGSYMADTKEVMGQLVHAVGFDQRLEDKRNGVFPELQKLAIPMEDQFAANSLILATDERVIEFYSIPEQMREVWVGMLLAGKLVQKTTLNVNDEIRASWTVLHFGCYVGAFWAFYCCSLVVILVLFSGLANWCTNLDDFAHFLNLKLVLSGLSTAAVWLLYGHLLCSFVDCVLLQFGVHFVGVFLALVLQ